MKTKYFIGGLVIVTAIVLASLSFGDNLKQYVTIAEAKKYQNEVQVKGRLLLDEIQYDMEKQVLNLSIADDKGEKLLIQYRGIKPGNLEQAKEIVAIGRYDGKYFEASKLLVKCPSKYTEQGEQI